MHQLDRICDNQHSYFAVEIDSSVVCFAQMHYLTVCLSVLYVFDVQHLYIYISQNDVSYRLV